MEQDGCIPLGYWHGCQRRVNTLFLEGWIGGCGSSAQDFGASWCVMRQEREVRIRSIDLVNRGQVRGDLAAEIGYIRGRELRLALDILDDEVGRREECAGLIEMMGCRHSQSCAAQDVQEFELVLCCKRVVLQSAGARPADDHSAG